MTGENKDFRIEDIKKLNQERIENKWIYFWENYMSNESDEIKNINQKMWHISRLSFLEGFKLGRGDSK